MTKEEFKEKVGHEPENDDLERVNCLKAGKVGHHFCGWCSIHDLPRFLCGCPGGLR
jgi:hypothetical protein